MKYFFCYSTNIHSKLAFPLAGAASLNLPNLMAFFSGKCDFRKYNDPNHLFGFFCFF